ncbi:MAG: MBL fold metallo-hydrolase [Gemmatimonadaceae bacterium]
MTDRPSIVNVGYRSANIWVVSVGRQRLLVDLGLWGMFSALTAILKRADIPLREITHGVATHYHGDHAGAAQDLKNAGLRLIVADEQVAAIPLMKRHAKDTDRYTEITPDGNLVVSCAESRALLAILGVHGQFVHMFATEKTMEQVMASWACLRALGARTVYAGHGPVRPMPTA